MAMKGELEELRGAYVLSHPARSRIVRLLKKEGKAYPAKIAEALQLSERLVSFHLSMLSTAGFVKSEYGLSNPVERPPRMVRYYELTPKVDKTLEKFMAAFK